MKRLFFPRWMLILSMTIFGTIGLFVRKTGVSSGVLALYRAVLAAAVLGAYLLITGIGDMSGSGEHLKGIPRTFLQFLAAITVLIPYVALTGGVTMHALDAAGWVYLLVVGLVHTGIAYCLFFSALKELPGQKTPILSYIDPLVAVILSVTVLGEPMSMPQVIGGALILGFTLWNEIGGK